MIISRGPFKVFSLGAAENEGVNHVLGGHGFRAWVDKVVNIDKIFKFFIEFEDSLCGGLFRKAECELSFHFFVRRVCLMEECLKCIVSIVAGLSDLCKIRISWEDMCFTDCL